MDITQVLLNAQSPDTAVRGEAERWLQNAEAQNRPMYLATLASELAGDHKSPLARRLAGLILKNSLDAREEQRKAGLVQQWISMDPNVRLQIKQSLMATLSSAQYEARHTAAQVVAKIALIELPRNLWADVIATLVGNMTKVPASPDTLKQSTLETLGFICEEIEPSVVVAQSNQILTAVVQGMRAEEPSVEVKLAACNALFNALEFVKANFEAELERDFIMTVVCEAAVAGNANIRVSAFECLVKIASLYYEKLPSYMQRIFSITLNAIKNDEAVVVLQAVEFWSTLCDEEIYLLDEAEEARENGDVPPVCHQFIKGALQFLVPLITETLTKQEEDADEDAWNVAMAGATCLDLIANTVKDDIITAVMPFIQENIVNPNWRQKEAAIMAFGSVLEGPEQTLIPLIQQAVPVLVQHTKDTNEMVKDTAAWTLARICQLHPGAIKESIAPLLGVLIECLKDTPRVASNACWGILNIANAFHPDNDNRPGPSLQPYFQATVQALLMTTERNDVDENNLRSSLYEAINAMIENSDDTCLPIIALLVPVFLERLQRTLQMQILNSDDRDTQIELQALLCGVLQSATSKLGAQIAPFSDQMMQLYLQVFNIKSASVHEEALMAVGQLANALEGEFEKYMSYFRPYLHVGLRNYEEHMVCSVAVGIVGDISRALGKKMVVYCDEIISLLLQDLQNNQLNKTVKPPILSCFGDIALAIGSSFGKYLSVVMGMLQQASGTTVNNDDDEMVEFLNDLREGVFEAYTGILQGIRYDQDAQTATLTQMITSSYAQPIVNFIAHVFADPARSKQLTRAAVGVLGDLGHSCGPAVKPLLQQPFVKEMVRECLASDDDSTRDVAAWVKDIMQTWGI